MEESASSILRRAPGSAAPAPRRLTEDLPEGTPKTLRVDNETILSKIGPFEIQTIRIAP